MKFSEWLKFNERFTEPPPLGDPARRPDLIRGGLDGCSNVPSGMKSACQPTTSAFPTYSLAKQKKMRKR